MLIPLSAGEYPAMAPLFGPTYPNLAFVHGVLEGKLPGRAWAQRDGDRVTACLLATGSPFCFAAGSLTPAIIEEMLALLRPRPPVKLVHPPGLSLPASASRHGFAEAERLQFSRPDIAGAERRALEIPEGFELARIDAALFQRLNWREAVLAIFGSAENYLKSGIGYCLLREGRVVTEAHGVVGGGLVELGTFTHPDYRRRGLPLIPLAEVVRRGAAIGLQATSSCDTDRHASAALSCRLGMSQDFRYNVLSLPA